MIIIFVDSALYLLSLCLSGSNIYLPELWIHFERLLVVNSL